jgi:hypothetical protein
MKKPASFSEYAFELRLMARDEAGGAEKVEEFILFTEEKSGEVFPGLRATLCDMRKRCRQLGELHELLIALAPIEEQLRALARKGVKSA